MKIKSEAHIEFTREDIEIIFRSLRSCIDLSDNLFPFVPVVSHCGLQTDYTNGELDEDEAIREAAIVLWKKIKEVIRPITQEQREEIKAGLKKYMNSGIDKRKKPV